MANIVLTLNQTAFDNLILDGLPALPPVAVGGLPDAPDGSKITLGSRDVRLSFPDGSYYQLDDVALSADSIVKGKVAASGVAFVIPGVAMAEATGQYSFSYDLAGHKPALHTITAVTNTLTLTTLAPTSSPAYGKLPGNLALRLAGAMTVDADGHVGGRLDAVDLTLADGSHLQATGLGVHLDGASLPDLLTGGGAGLAGDDTIRLDLPAAAWKAFTFDAGAGTDTVVLAGARAGYTVTQTAAGLDVAGANGTEHLAHVERLAFDGGASAGGAPAETLAFDADGHAGQAYRLYQAAFDRAPDSVGLGYWIDALDHGTSLRQAASDFLASTEFATRYGTNLDNRAFVTRLYDNVLHRAYDQAGFDFWVDVLDHGESRASVLTGFSESAENQAQLIGTIRSGIAYTTYHAPDHA